MINALVHPDDLAEEFGDGYTNEYQRALAFSQMTRVRKDELPRAKALAAIGKFVLVSYYTVYCRATDAILGEDNRIIGIAKDYETAVGMGLNHGATDSDERLDVICPPDFVPPWKAALLAELNAPSATNDDNIPF